MFVFKVTKRYSRFFLAYFVCIYFVVDVLTRLVYKRYLKKVLRNAGKTSLMIITTSELVEQTLRDMKFNSFERYYVKCIVLMDVDRTGDDAEGIPIVAGMHNMLDYVLREWVDEVMAVLPAGKHLPGKIQNGLTQMGIVVHESLIRHDKKPGVQKTVENIGKYTVLTTTISEISPIGVALKRLMDIVGGFVGCLITVVLCIILGPMIYIKSPGPIFFSQERIGKNGRKFKIFKFRSMYMDAEERKAELMKKYCEKGMMFKMEEDPRIIGSSFTEDGTYRRGIGNFIRDWSLDEFPQFWNVLVGDMSLVGTRPPTVDEWERYEPWHRCRMAAKPGITGMWQVSGRSKIKNFDEVVKLDTKYISTWSIGLDIKILFKTVLVVLRKDGAM